MVVKYLSSFCPFDYIMPSGFIKKEFAVPGENHRTSQITGSTNQG